MNSEKIKAIYDNSKYILIYFCLFIISFSSAIPYFTKFLNLKYSEVQINDFKIAVISIFASLSLGFIVSNLEKTSKMIISLDSKSKNDNKEYNEFKDSILNHLNYQKIISEVKLYNVNIPLQNWAFNIVNPYFRHVPVNGRKQYCEYLKDAFKHCETSWIGIHNGDLNIFTLSFLEGQSVGNNEKQLLISSMDPDKRREYYETKSYIECLNSSPIKTKVRIFIENSNNSKELSRGSDELNAYLKSINKSNIRSFVVSEHFFKRITSIEPNISTYDIAVYDDALAIAYSEIENSMIFNINDNILKGLQILRDIVINPNHAEYLNVREIN